MVQMNFDSSQYAPSQGAGGSVFETGTYAFQIVNSEVKQTKSGSGTMLVFTHECIDPEFARKRFTQRLNVQNPNQQAVEIAFAELSALSIVCGVPQWSDTQQLHGKPFKLMLEKVARDDDPSKFSNNILAILDMNEQPAGAPGAGGGAPQAPAAPPQQAQPPAQQAAPPQQQAPAQQSAPWQQPAQQPPAEQQQAPVQAAPQPPQQAAPSSAPPWQGGPGSAAPATGAPSTPPWQQQ